MPESPLLSGTNKILITDEMLINSIKAGDFNALLAIRDRHYKYLVVYAYHFTRCEQESLDIVQECFIDFWERRHSLKGASFNIAAYLTTATRYRSLDHLEKIRTRQKHTVRYYSRQHKTYTPDPAVNNELKQELHEAIHSLPAQQFKVFVDKYIEGKRYKEISECHGITENTVRSYLAEAMKQLRMKLIHLK